MCRGTIGGTRKLAETPRGESWPRPSSDTRWPNADLACTIWACNDPLRGSVAVMKIAAIAAALGSAASPVFGACTSDAIDVMASDGEILITASGQMYHVLPGDDFYSLLWLPTEKIIICGDGVMTSPGGSHAVYAIINLDEN